MIRLNGCFCILFLQRNPLIPVIVWYTIVPTLILCWVVSFFWRLFKPFQKHPFLMSSSVIVDQLTPNPVKGNILHLLATMRYFLLQILKGKYCIFLPCLSKSMKICRGKYLYIMSDMVGKWWVPLSHFTIEGPYSSPHGAQQTWHWLISRLCRCHLLVSFQG